MPDIPSKVKSLIDSVRSKLTNTPSGRTVDKRGRGYQLYVKEQEAMGESAAPYDQWIKTQSPDIGGQ